MAAGSGAVVGEDVPWRPSTLSRSAASLSCAEGPVAGRALAADLAASCCETSLSAAFRALAASVLSILLCAISGLRSSESELTTISGCCATGLGAAGNVTAGLQDFFFAGPVQSRVETHAVLPSDLVLSTLWLLAAWVTAPSTAAACWESPYASTKAAAMWRLVLNIGAPFLARASAS